jgi:hypothetical protein
LSAKISPFWVAAEASLWVAGALLVAGAAGMHWNVDLPGVVATPSPAIVASTSPGPSAGATAIAHGSAGPSSRASQPVPNTVLGKFKAFMNNADLQFKADTWTQVYGADASGTLLLVTKATGTDSLKADDCSEVYTGSVQTGSSTTKGSSQAVNVGTVHYELTGKAWTHRDRMPSDKCSAWMPWIKDWSYTDTGVELFSGVRGHRLELQESAAFATLLESRSTGTSNWSVTLAYWVDDDGKPLYAQISGTFDNKTGNGVSLKNTTIMQFHFTSFSGVTITAPTK